MMKSIGEFFKTTLLGGLFVILPLLLLYMLMAEVVDIIVVLATPIADLFPEGTFDEIKYQWILALILIVCVSFIIGLALRTETGRRIGRWIENVILGRLPAYKALKGLTTGFAEAGKEGAFKPAMLVSADGEKEPAYVVEDHGDGQVTVLLPWSPASFAGSLKVVNQDRIEVLDVSIGDFSRVLGNWGIGASDIKSKVRTEKIGSIEI
jgi:uncharacterized membrane protein